MSVKCVIRKAVTADVPSVAHLVVEHNAGLGQGELLDWLYLAVVSRDVLVLVEAWRNNEIAGYLIAVAGQDGWGRRVVELSQAKMTHGMGVHAIQIAIEWSKAIGAKRVTAVVGTYGKNGRRKSVGRAMAKLFAMEEVGTLHRLVLP